MMTRAWITRAAVMLGLVLAGSATGWAHQIPRQERQHHRNEADRLRGQRPQARQDLQTARQGVRAARQEFKQTVRPGLRGEGMSKQQIRSERKGFLAPHKAAKVEAKSNLGGLNAQIRYHKNQANHKHVKKDSGGGPSPTKPPWEW